MATLDEVEARITAAQAAVDLLLGEGLINQTQSDALYAEIASKASTFAANQIARLQAKLTDLDAHVITGDYPAIVAMLVQEHNNTIYAQQAEINARIVHLQSF